MSARLLFTWRVSEQKQNKLQITQVDYLILIIYWRNQHVRVFVDARYVFIEFKRHVLLLLVGVMCVSL